MAVTGDTWLPSQFLPDEDDDVLSDNLKNNNNNNNNHGSALKQQDQDDDLIAELTQHMAHFMLQDDDDTYDFSDNGSHTRDLELSWDLRGSPQSSVWSRVGSNQGSSEGSSQEPSPPATPGYGMIGMFEKMNLDERGSSKYQHSCEIQSLKSSNIGGLCSYQSLIQEQIRAIELSRLKQDQAMSSKQKSAPHVKGHGQISQKSEPKQKKGKVGGGNGRRTHPQTQQQQLAGSGMRALFLGGSGSRGGTGVFLPRGAPSESTNKQGKGCSTVLIPARVVQALQQHFDKTAAISGPKLVGFPPLHDVLVNNRDGMYSLQNLQSMKEPANVQNEMNLLPQEWTY